MTYDEFVEELGRANLSGREFARLLRLNPNTISNYKKTGTVPSNLVVVAVLLRMLEEHNIPYRQVLEGLDIEPNAPRGRPLGQSAPQQKGKSS